MPIRFHCPVCHVRLSVAQRKAGHRSPCPNCRQQITIPQPKNEGGPWGHRESESLERSVPDAPTVEMQAPALPPPQGAFAAGATRVDPPRDHLLLADPIQEIRGGPAPLMGEPAANPEREPGDGAGRAASDRPGDDVVKFEPATDVITLRRWVVYFQAGLLAVAATTFFFLGLMIGQNSGKNAKVATDVYDCQLTGQVFVADRGKSIPDEGAVVILVPADVRVGPEEKTAGELLFPDRFEAADNPSIDAIEGMGGRIVRINNAGEFDLTLLGPREYLVIIVSRFGVRPDSEKIPKSDVADINGYFSTAQELIGDKKYKLQKYVLSRRSQAMPRITF